MDNRDTSASAHPEAKRRALLKAGLAAAPVVATLRSGSVFAGSSSSGGNYMHISAFCSVKADTNLAVSRVHGGTNEGCRPQDWQARDHECKKRYYFKADYRESRDWSKGCAEFERTSDESCETHSNSTVGDMLCNSRNDYEKLARHCSALYLTAITQSWDCLYSEHEVKDMWQQCVRTGIWQPASGGPQYTLREVLDYCDYIHS